MRYLPHLLALLLLVTGCGQASEVAEEPPEATATATADPEPTLDANCVDAWGEVLGEEERFRSVMNVTLFECPTLVEWYAAGFDLGLLDLGDDPEEIAGSFCSAMGTPENVAICQEIGVP